MKIFKIITIATIANGFKLIEDSDYFKGELTTTTATTTTDTTTTETTTTETATMKTLVDAYKLSQLLDRLGLPKGYGDEMTTTTETTTTTADLVNASKLSRRFKLPERLRLRQEYDDEWTSTTSTTTETITTTETSATDTTTTETAPILENYLRNGQKLQRWQDIATKKYEEYVCMILRRLGQQSSDCSDLEARDSVIETPKLELRSMRQSH